MNRRRKFPKRVNCRCGAALWTYFHRPVPGRCGWNSLAMNSNRSGILIH